MRALVQGDLYERPPARRRLTPAERLEEKRDYVRRVRRGRVCACCCREEGLLFVRRDDGPPVCRLVEAEDVALRELVRVLARTYVLCRRCLLARARPKMLRGYGRASVGNVA